jgi:hypothetical protein
MGWIVSCKNLRFEALTSSASECGLIREWGPCRWS